MDEPERDEEDRTHFLPESQDQLELGQEEPEGGVEVEVCPVVQQRPVERLEKLEENEKKGRGEETRLAELTSSVRGRPPKSLRSGAVRSSVGPGVKRGGLVEIERVGRRRDVEDTILLLTRTCRRYRSKDQRPSCDH